jgi:transposase
MIENPDVIEAIYPIADVCECGSPLDKKSARLKERRQQIEIPEPITITTEYRIDNNQAERMVRPVKVKIKVIGGFRSVGGSEAFCVIRSIWETNKLNSINPFDTLRGVFAG